jgi:ribosomal protein S17
MNQTRGQLKTLTGMVVSDKMDKTIVVSVPRSINTQSMENMLPSEKNIMLMMNKSRLIVVTRS